MGETFYLNYSPKSKLTTGIKAKDFAMRCFMSYFTKCDETLYYPRSAETVLGWNKKMNFYSKYILPKIVHFICQGEPITSQREKVVPLAKGRVLEIGFGSGLNLPLYRPDKVNQVWGLDPSRELWAVAEKNMRDIEFDVNFLETSAEDIPLDNNSADTVLVTYTLCSIPQIQAALSEMQRVLTHEGQLIFCEHGLAPDESVRRWQNRLNPIWKQVSGGCHLNRHIPSHLEQAGFKIQALDTMYISNFKVAGFNYWGTANSQ